MREKQHNEVVWKLQRDLEKLKKVLEIQFSQNNQRNKDWRNLFRMLKRLNSVNIDYNYKTKQVAEIVKALVTVKPFIFFKLKQL